MLFLKRNLPHRERALRIGSGAIIGWAALQGFVTGILFWLALATAATLLLTAFVGFCPACAMLGRRYLDK